MDKKDSSKSILSRRDFLKTAVMSVATISVSPVLSSFQDKINTHEEFDIVGGILTDIGDGWIRIDGGNDNIMHLGVHRKTSIWKGGESDAAVLQEGDDIMAKISNLDGSTLRIWSNLTRIKGRTIQRVAENIYRLETSHHRESNEDILLELLPSTIYMDMLTKNLNRDNMELIFQDDVHLDVIGEQITDGIRATRVFIYRPGPRALFPSIKDLEVREITTTGCTIGYLGWASWENCPTGGGGCAGSCNTNNNKQTAWPAIQTCGSCSGTCCDCSKGCRNQVHLSCGTNLQYVKDHCGIQRSLIKIVDCGPCQNCSGYEWICNNSCCCCRNYTSAIVDLTRPTFAAFGYDPANIPCFSCTAMTNAPC